MMTPGSPVKPTVKNLRVLLRDQNKHIWTDDELEDMLDHGLTWWNMVTPVTSLSLIDLRIALEADKNPQGAAVIWGSVVLALTHLLWHGGTKPGEHGQRGESAPLDSDQRELYETLLADAEAHFEQSKLTKLALTKPGQTVTWN